ncbi:hypothetical protein FACHB389_11330 [Nostoc calcicola FACHB-389]|nr:response regulator [Nostoc calcicola FACHB-3891]MDZ8058978.1 response regulator [Nostoc sp. EkiNYC01]OKH36276.1 hypothetical protein FACHB389_11330 [Nostoc calcicola FACHB-389]
MAASDKEIIGFEGSLYAILMVDDRWENCTLITNLLQPLSFYVIEASNGQESLQKAISIVKDWASRLEETDTTSALFACELRQLARQFDEDLIFSFLTQYAVETV